MALQAFSNNARGVLGQEMASDATMLILNAAESDIDRFAPIGAMQHSTVQTLTITDPTNPEMMEIVAMTRAYGSSFRVKRGLEGTTPLTWPEGSVVEARITAGMLNSFMQIGRDEEFQTPYLTEIQIIPKNFYPSYSAPMFATPVMGRSMNVSVGLVEDEFGPNSIERGGIVMHPDREGVYFVSIDEWEYEQPIPDIPPVEYSGEISILDMSEQEKDFYAQRMDDPIIIDIASTGVYIVITEVGFVCTRNDGGGPAQVTVSVGTDTIAENASLNESAQMGIARFPNNLTRLTPPADIDITVTQRSPGAMEGYFYWIGFPVAQMQP